MKIRIDARIAVGAAAVLALAQVAFARTLAWHHFDDTPGTVRGLGYEYTNSVDGTKYPARLSSFVQSWGGTFIPLMATNFLAAPCNVYKDGVDGVPVINTSAISHTYDPYDSDDHGGGIITIREGTDDRDLHVQTGTVECFMKTTAGNHWISLISRYNGASGLTFNLYTEGANIKLKYVYDTGDGGTAEETLTLSGSAYKILGDGHWHHLAFTVDEATHAFAMYIDYRVFGTATLKGSLHYVDGTYWCFGGSANAGWKSGGAWDEIRFSDEVLPRKSMLRFGNTNADGDVLFRFSFEGNCDSDVHPELNAPADEAYAVQRAANFSAGKLAYAALEPQCVEDGLGNLLLPTNRSALEANGTNACIAISNFNLRCYSTMTLEFFMKADESSSAVPQWGSFFSMVQDGGLRLFLCQRNNDNLYVVLDNPTETSGSVSTTNPNLFDGEWHHVAFTVNIGSWKGNPTQDTIVYIDYKREGSKSQMGTASAMPETFLSLGHSKAHLFFDEIRLTKGVLPVSRFQRRMIKRTLITIR